jgi:WD40 repeat protein
LWIAQPSSAKSQAAVEKITNSLFPITSKVIHVNSFLGISPDFKAYAMSDANGVKVIDLETAENLPGPKWDHDWGHPFSAAFSQDAVALKEGEKFFGNSRNVRVFSRKTGELKHNVKMPEVTPGLIERIAFTSDGKFLVAELQGLFGGPRLVLRDVQQKKTIDELDLNKVPEADQLVLHSFPMPWGKPVLGYESYKGNDHQVFTVEVKAGKLVKNVKLVNYHEMKGVGKSSRLRAISPAGHLIACTTLDDDIVLYDIVNKKVAHKLEGHLDSVRTVAFSPNGEIVASAAKDKTIRFWDVKQGKEVRVIKGVRADAKELIFSPDGDRIAIVYYTSPPSAEIRSVELK